MSAPPLTHFTQPSKKFFEVILEAGQYLLYID